MEFDRPTGTPVGPLPADLRRGETMPERTSVEFHGDDVWINGHPTYAGRSWQGHRIEGLLLNSRMVQAIFDDRNLETRERWRYPDTQRWDPERNTNELISMLPEYRRFGLLAVTLNLQGGSPEGYSQLQPWHTSGFEADGTLRPDYPARLRRTLDRLDQLGMVAILGLFPECASQLADQHAPQAGVL
jgi:hypothetical protein